MTWLQVTCIFILTLSLFSCNSDHQPALGSQDLPIVSSLPRDDDVIRALDAIRIGFDYRCMSMIRATNLLRHVGKRTALQLLSEYLHLPNSGFDRQIKVALLCRLLFIAPKEGWQIPSFGLPLPEINAPSIGSFPVFPLGISNGVPFLLIDGYSFDGLSMEAETSLKTCENLAISPVDLPTTNIEAAAELLTRNRAFQLLYVNQSEAAKMTMRIRTQVQ